MARKPHALCIPFTATGHINAMLKLSNILHFKGVHITFVNPDFMTPGILVPQKFESLPYGFRFETLSGCSSANDVKSGTGTGTPAAIRDSISTNCATLVRNLITKLNSSTEDPPVSCIIWDSIMFYLQGSDGEFEIPHVQFWCMSASLLMVFLHKKRIEEDMELLKDKDKELDFIPGLQNFRIKDLPDFFWEENEIYRSMMNSQVEETLKAPAIILHTSDALETKVLDAMKPLLPPVYTIGPLNFLEQQIPDKEERSFKSNQFKENQECIDWLNSQETKSVVYVNFGSTTVMTREQLIEFGWGLANCIYPFLWVIREDLVGGEDPTLPREFIQDTADRSMICSWCPQEKVLHHPSTALFLTHSGWNSIMDAMTAGVPVINWPFFTDQQTNCWTTCVQWGTGMEMDKNARRDAIVGLIREAMDGTKGKEMKQNAINWRKKAEESTKEGGSSYKNLEKLINERLTKKKD